MGGCDGCVIHQCVSEVPERDSGCCSSSRPFQLHEPAALGRSDPAEEGGGTGEKQAERNISSLGTPQLSCLDRTKGGSASKKSGEQKLLKRRTSQPEDKLNATSRTCVRNRAWLWIYSSAQLKEGVRERERENRGMESAEGFESAAQIAHKVLNHACSTDTREHKDCF